MQILAARGDKAYDPLLAPEPEVSGPAAAAAMQTQGLRVPSDKDPPSRPEGGALAMKVFGALMLLALAAWSGVAARAEAGLPPAALSGVAVEARPNALLPLSLAFVDENGAAFTLGDALGGKPTLLLFADYTCRTLCGPIVEFAASGLEKSGLKPGIDYRLVVVGLDPKDGPAEALAMRSSHIGADSRLAAAATMLIGNEAVVRALTEATGYRYAYDDEHDQFAHPAAAYVITSEGRIARVLSGLGLDGNDLRLALVEAGEGRIGTFVDRFRLLCYASIRRKASIPP
jgi:protein SCO1/2